MADSFTNMRTSHYEERIALLRGLGTGWSRDLADQLAAALTLSRGDYPATLNRLRVYAEAAAKFMLTIKGKKYPARATCKDLIELLRGEVPPVTIECLDRIRQLGNAGSHHVPKRLRPGLTDVVEAFEMACVVGETFQVLVQDVGKAKRSTTAAQQHADGSARRPPSSEHSATAGSDGSQAGRTRETGGTSEDQDWHTRVRAASFEPPHLDIKLAETEAPIFRSRRAYLTPLQMVATIIGGAVSALSGFLRSTLKTVAILAYICLFSGSLVAIYSVFTALSHFTEDLEELRLELAADQQKRERSQALRAARYSDDIGAILPYALMNDSEAMLEASFLLDRLARSELAAGWDRRLATGGDVNGIVRMAIREIRGDGVPTDKSRGGVTLAGPWNSAFREGIFASRELDPRVASELAAVYFEGVDDVLAPDYTKSASFAVQGRSADPARNDEIWVLACGSIDQHARAYADCEGWVDALWAMNDDGSGEVDFIKGTRFETGDGAAKNLERAKSHYRKARDAGHIAAAERLFELGELIRGGTGWDKAVSQANRGQRDAMRYVGFGCAEDTLVAPPDFGCVERMLSPFANEGDQNAALEVCIALDGLRRHQDAEWCDSRLAAVGNVDARARYGIKLMRRKNAAIDVYRGRALTRDLLRWEVDPRTAYLMGEYLVSEGQLYDATYWLQGAMQKEAPGARFTWLTVCAHTFQLSDGLGWCEGYEHDVDEIIHGIPVGPRNNDSSIVLDKWMIIAAGAPRD